MPVDATVRPTTRFLNLGHAFAHLVMLLYPTVVLAIEGQWGLGYAELLPLGFAGYLLFGLGALPAGWLADRIDSGRMMLAFFVGTGCACLLAGSATGPWTLALGLTLIGLFASIYHPVAIAWLVSAGDRPGRTLGINGVWGAAGIGGAGLIAGGLAELLHWRAAFLVPGGLCLAVGILFGLGLGRGQLAMIRRRIAAGGGIGEGVDRRRGLVLMMAAILCAGLIFQIISVGMPKIFQARLGDTIGFGALAAGSLVSVVYAVSALGQVAGGMLADRYDQRWVYPLSYGLQVLILLLALVSHDLWLVLLVALAVTVQTGTQPVENCLLARYTPLERRATVYGLKFVLGLGLSSVGVPLVAVVYGLTGSFDGVFAAMILCSLGAATIGLMLPRPVPAVLTIAAEPARP